MTPPEGGARWVDIARIQSVNPARRQIRALRRAPAAVFEALDWVHVATAGAAPLKCRVAHVRVRGDVVLIELAAGVPRDTVGTMRGAALVMPAAERMERAPAAHGVAELQGMTVLGPDGAVMGSVTGSMETAAHSVIEIRRPSGRVILVPVIEDVVQSVDWVQGALIVGDIAPYDATDAD